MDRKPLREFTHKVDNFLTVKNSDYKQWIFRYTFLELEKDLGSKGDITTNTLIKTDTIVSATIIAREAGILAGEAEINYFLKDADAKFRPRLNGSFEIVFKVHDGEEFVKDTKILEIKGSARDILIVERIVLNLLMRMSGIASFTKSIVDIVKDDDVLIVPTRKTLWGLLDKRAVLLGGGGTHRINLSDAVLVKENHLTILNSDFDNVLDRISDARLECRFVEIEVENKDQAIAAAEAFNKVLGSKIRSVAAILLDNMKPDEIKETLEAIKEKNLYNELLFEASGGINEKNLKDYANTGVDIISMGCLTSGVKSLDMSLKIA